MNVIDPMHNLALGLVQKEVSLLIDNEKNENNQRLAISKSNKMKLKDRIKSKEMTSDCNWLSSGMTEKSTVDRLTAQQWLIMP